MKIIGKNIIQIKKLFLRFIRLDSFKRFIKSLRKNNKISNDEKMIKHLEKILFSAKQIAKTNNSKLYFVYLSGYHRYGSFFPDRYKFINNYPKIINMVNNLDISVIDIHNEFFVKERYPLDYFPFSKYGHYNEKGYRKCLILSLKKLNKKNYYFIFLFLSNKKNVVYFLIYLVPSARLESGTPLRARILSPLCLPISPRGQFKSVLFQSLCFYNSMFLFT